METVTGFRTPEEAALDLAIPLLGALASPSPTAGPVAAVSPEDESLRRGVGHVAERILRSTLAEEGCLGLAGDLAASQRAAVTAALAAAVAADRSAVLVDADLRHAHLSFDDRRRAQEGLVDVLRYGVRSPRVVAPTATPGLALLPVGSRTVDLPGTFGAESVPTLFGELRRGGEFLVVNGPDLVDLDGAMPFLDQIPAWVLLVELGASDPERLRALRDRLGKDRCVGVLTIGAPLATVEPPAAPEREPIPASEEELPWEETPLETPVSPRAEEPAAEPAFPAPLARPEELYAPQAAVPIVTARRPRGLALWGAAVLLVAIAGALWFGPQRTRLAEPPAAPPAAGRTMADVVPGASLPLESPGTTAGTEAPPEGSTRVEPAPTSAGEGSGETAGALPSTGTPAATESQVSSAPALTPAPSPASTSMSAAEAAAPSAPLGDIVWAVHVSSVKDRAGALSEAARLAANDRPTFVKETEVPGRGTWWRVYVGPFGARVEADRAAAALKQAGEDAQVYRLARADIEAGTGREDR